MSIVDSGNWPISRRDNLRLTLAINDYDQTRDLVSGLVPVDGIDLTCLVLPVEETFFRFSNFREWHVSELSMGKYCSLRAGGDDSIVAIPVFPSRVFRHAALFVRAGSAVTSPSELKGRRVGIPEWTQTATVYARGLLADTYGVPITTVEWFQGGINEPGRVEGIPVELPAGVSCTAVPDRTLTELLIDGELDALITAHPPEEFEQGSGRLARLIANYREVEEEYFRRTGIFPIMHVIAVRADVYHEHPWVLMTLYKAFEQAKRRSLVRATDANTSKFPFPWGFEYVRRIQDLMGEDPWPYGVAPNRVTLDAFLEMAYRQGVCKRRLTPEELFPAEVQREFRI